MCRTREATNMEFKAQVNADSKKIELKKWAAVGTMNSSI